MNSSSRNGDTSGGLDLLSAFAMYLMACLARHRWLIGKARADQMPRARCICGWTRSRMGPLKCIPWHRKQSSIIMRFELCMGSAKIWL